MKLFNVIFIFCLLFSIWQSCHNLLAESVFCSFGTEKVKLDAYSKSDEPENCLEFCGCSGFENAEVEINSLSSFGDKLFVLTDKSLENNYQIYPAQKYLKSIWQPPKINFIDESRIFKRLAEKSLFADS